jgi:hypothetical protein
MDSAPDNPMLTLKAMDVQPNIKRQKTYEMVTKSTCLGNLLSHGVYGLHALKAVNLFDDVNQVWEDSKDGITQYQESIFEPSQRIDNEQSAPDGGDLAQITNSPLLDGMSNEKLDKPDK